MYNGKFHISNKQWYDTSRSYQGFRRSNPERSAKALGSICKFIGVCMVILLIMLAVAA